MMKSRRTSSSACDIVVLGSYGTPNIGDEAILTALLGLIERYCERPAITVIGPDPGEISQRHNVVALSSQRTKDVIAKLRLFRKAHLLIVGGGGLLQDNRGASYLTGMVSSYVSQALLARLLGCRIAVVGVSIGPLSAKSSRWLVRALCTHATWMITRDLESTELALAMGSNPLTTSWVPDLTFALESGQSAAPRPPWLAAITNADYCVLSLRPLYRLASEEFPFGIPDKRLKDLVKFLCWVIKTADLDIVFVPFDIQRDEQVGEYAARLLDNQRRFHVLKQRLSVDQVLNLLDHAKITVGMRLHAVILSYLRETPVVPIVYDDKVANFARQIGVVETITPYNMDVERLQQAFIEALARTDVNNQADRLSSMRTRVYTAFEKLAQQCSRSDEGKSPADATADFRAF